MIGYVKYDYATYFLREYSLALPTNQYMRGVLQKHTDIEQFYEKLMVLAVTSVEGFYGLQTDFYRKGDL